MKVTSMESHQSDELTVRRYLLGRLDTSSGTTERLEERILVDSDLAEMVGVIEDEIIEEYLDDALDATDRDAVDQHFLRPRERREKLRLARLVNKSLDSQTTGQAEGEKTLYQGRNMTPSPLVWRPGIRVWAQASACVLLVLALAFAFKEQQDKQIARVQNAQQLATERARSGQLEREVEELRQLKQPSTVFLNLVEPGLLRGQASVTTVQLGSGVKKIHAEIPLRSAPPSSVDVRLENSTGKTIWTKTVLPFRLGADGLLILDVPAENIGPGDYSFVVPQKSGDGIVRFAFRVEKPNKSE
jgi:hypothetical protein